MVCIRYWDILLSTYFDFAYLWNSFCSKYFPCHIPETYSPPRRSISDYNGHIKNRVSGISNVYLRHLVDFASDIENETQKRSYRKTVDQDLEHEYFVLIKIKLGY